MFIIIIKQLNIGNRKLQGIFILKFRPIVSHTIGRDGINSIMELMVNSNSGIDYLKKVIGIDKFGIEVSYNKIKSKNKYFSIDNSTWNINYSE